jgi:hypothetical protein
MDSVWSRSWKLTKLSFSVILQDKELLVLPILSLIFSLAVMVVTWLPLGAWIPTMKEGEDHTLFFLGIFFVLYFALNFTALFFNVCAVYIIKQRLEGGDGTLWQSFAFALSRLHWIAGWSLITTTMGLLLKFLERLASNRKGNAVMSVIASAVARALLGGLKLTWSVATLFVVPVMVYKDLGPIRSIQESKQMLRKTWGESLVREFGLGATFFLVLLLGSAPIVGVGYWSYSSNVQSPVYWIFIVGILTAYICLVSAVFSVANTVYNTALYAYADTGKTPNGFSDLALTDAFRGKA